MICPACKEAGLKSSVYQGAGFDTGLSQETFWDENGMAHIHRFGSSSRAYSCTKGHRWARFASTKCPAPECDFGKPASIVVDRC